MKDAKEAQLTLMSTDVFEDPIKLLQWLSDNDGTFNPDDNLDWIPISQPDSGLKTSRSHHNDRSIDCLVKLRPAIRQRLKQNGIRTIGHLESLGNDEIMKLPGFGVKKANEIREALMSVSPCNPESLTPEVKSAPEQPIRPIEDKPALIASRAKAITKNSIPVHSKRTGKSTISVSEIICIRPYGAGTSVDTHDSWYVCDLRPMQLASFLEGGLFAFLNYNHSFSGAVRKNCVSKVSQNADGHFSVCIDEADAAIQSAGKPISWYIDNFGSEKVLDLNGVPISEQNNSLKSAEHALDGYSVSSPELIGLLFGIVCDDIINLQEAKMLRKWLGSAEIHEDGAIKIRELLDRVLDDDVVSPDEEMQMLNIFNRIINLDEHFSTRKNDIE